MKSYLFIILILILLGCGRKGEETVSSERQAPDFEFMTREGELHRFRDYEGEPLLLVFYDPACTHCSEILIPLEQSLRERHKGLKVLAVYTEGNEKLWRETCHEMPGWWTVAIDRSGIVEKEIYDVYAMPMLILLDKDQNILLFDPTAERLLGYLNHTK